MPEKELCFGIVGTGMIAEFHAQAIAAVPGANLAGVTSRGAAARNAFAEKHKVRAYVTLEEMLADKDVNAIAIASPSGYHAEPTILAARAGKHVMCEKPLEVTPAKAQKLINACRFAGVILAPIFQYRYGAGARLIKEALDCGRFGKVLFSSARIKWFRPQSYYNSAAWRGTWELDGGGCLINQSIHAIDLMLSFGGIPAEVYGAWGTQTHTIEVEDTAAALVRFKNGVIGTIEASTSCNPGFPLEVSVSGEKGTAVLSGDAISCWSFIDKHPLDERVPALQSSMGSGASDPKGISIKGHVEVVTNLLKAVNGDPSGLVDPLEARYPIDVICGVYESQRTGRPVRLPWTPVE